jgi:hypothetical protein
MRVVFLLGWSLFFIPLVLVGCGSSSKQGGGLGFASGIDGGRKKGRILIMPVEGTTIPMGQLLAKAVSGEIMREGIYATTDKKAEIRFRLAGRVDFEQDPELDFVARINWTLFDSGGDSVGEYVQGVSTERWKWDYGDPKVIRSVAKAAARPIIDLLGVDEIVEERKGRRPLGVLIKPIIGAPGDGNIALREALIKGLRADDMAITSDLRQTAFVVEGRVFVSENSEGNVLTPLTGRQKVRIVWTVRDAKGKAIGQAAQENTINKARLRGAWGNLAEKVAAAAKESIKKAMGFSDKPSAVQTKRQGPPVPVYKVPTVPGRALPPPS